MSTVFIMTSRACGLIALGTGIAYWMGYDVPLHLHMGIGVLLVLAVWGLAATARRQASGLALIGTICAALVPLLGLMQVYMPIGDTPAILQALHVAVAVSAIGLAEALAKQHEAAPVSGP